MTFKIKASLPIFETEKEIFLNNKCFVCDDGSYCIVRSRLIRVKHKDKSIKVREYDKPMFQLDDIFEPNDNYNKYKVELQATLQ